MANTPFGLPTKALMLFLLTLALFFWDIPAWAYEFRYAEVDAIFILALSLAALGLFLKRRALWISFETSRIGFVRGVLLLAASALVYVYGSYSANVVWLHYMSLVLFVTGYVVLRVGTGLVRILAPLLPVFAFAFVPSASLGAFTPFVLVPLLDLLFGLSFVVFVGPRPRQLVLPLLVISIALGAWLGTGHGGPAYLPYLVPVPLLLLALPRVRGFAQLPKNSDYSCLSHTPEPNGFCSFCGNKVARAATSENYGGWGLLAVCTVVVLLLFTSMPMLTLAGGVNGAVYTARGPTLTSLPATPPGWQVNSTTLNSWTEGNSTYETIRVYVPLLHPETKNYTVYYSVSPSLNVPLPPSGDIPNWRWLSSALTPEGGIQGRLTTYVNGNTTMLSYMGSRTMTFLNGTRFASMYVTVGFVREFKNPNFGADTTEFLADIQALWVPGLNTEVLNSAWTSFVSVTVAQLSALEQLIAVAGSVSAIGWVAYRFTRSEESLDRFYTAASLTKERSWPILLELLKGGRRPRPGYELAGQGREFSQDEVDSALRSLAKEGLVKPELHSTGDSIRLVWKASA